MSRSAAVSHKSNAHYDHKMTGPTGRQIEAASLGRTAGAWMPVGDPVAGTGEPPTLSLISTVECGDPHQDYVGYRDGHGMVDRLAISVTQDGSVFLQVRLPGDGDEIGRVRSIPLAQLDRIIAAIYPAS